jgi:hypothetical protein
MGDSEHILGAGEEIAHATSRDSPEKATRNPRMTQPVAVAVAVMVVLVARVVVVAAVVVAEEPWAG